MITGSGVKLGAVPSPLEVDRVRRLTLGSLSAALATTLALGAGCTLAAAPDARLAAVEAVYADWVDANYAVQTLAAGPLTVVDGRGRAAWEARREERRALLASRLASLARVKLGPEDERARAAMSRTLAEPPTVPAAATEAKSAALCERAHLPELGREDLSHALYACFEHIGNHVPFEGRSIVRASALELLAELDTGERRRALFRALEPLWQAINANDEPTSPYRRLIALAARDAAKKGSSPVTDGARTVGASPAEATRWLTEVLEAWRAATAGPPIEPWDYWHHYGSGVAPLDARVPRAAVLALSKRYYHDLGADLDGLGVLHDLEVRPGKAPLAYADFVQTGRSTPAGWRPAISRVSANVDRGGLFVLNEIIHEDGHAVHMQAIRTRPAFFDLGDDLFVEAFADVTSWNVAEPAWQQRYLGESIDLGTGLRALFANVMLDVAWGLFETRMLESPTADPNAVWSDITSRYLNVRPHPELAWWALRVQLVDIPGYMINYGLGAILTAELRARIRAGSGDFAAGNPGWYRWTSANLLRPGSSVETPELLERFLGRPVSDGALLAEIARIGGRRR
jgi:hypothetical protein